MQSKSKEIKTINRSVLIAGAEALQLFVADNLENKTMGEVREIACKILSPEKMREFIAYGNSPHQYHINEDA